MDSESEVAKRFIDFYGWNGAVCGRNVSDFLASLNFNAGFRSPGNGGDECPRLPTFCWTRDNASELISAVLDRVQTPACYRAPHPQPPLPPQMSEWKFSTEYERNSPQHVWGYGLLFLTLINLCSMLGIIFLPCMKRRMYKFLMAFMLPMAIGSLLTTALLVLLPEALQLALIHEEVNRENSSVRGDLEHSPEGLLNRLFHAEHSVGASWKSFLSEHPWYLWRSCTVFGGIYMFFIIERLLKELIRWLGGSGHHGHSHHAQPISTSSVAPASPEAADLSSFRTAEIQMVPTATDVEASAAEPVTAEEPAVSLESVKVPACSCCDVAGFSKRLEKVQPVAWMILMGESLHNLVDGLSIGAAFTRSTLSGISICLAVLCEELPHELGDFAILLSAGMSMPMALACNFVSASICYLGFVMGVFIGETGSSIWVFAIGSGMFLYISLVDLVVSRDEPVHRGA